MVAESEQEEMEPGYYEESFIDCIINKYINTSLFFMLNLYW